jgi:DnaK suppressor protein
MTKTTKKVAVNKPAQAAQMTQVATDKQSKLQEQALLLKSAMSTNAASVVAYQQTSGDYGDMSQQSEQEWLFLSQNKANAKELELIQKALRRIQDGSYGICCGCAQAISPRRLRAIPWAECCIECQEGGPDGGRDGGRDSGRDSGRQPMGLTA